MRTKNRKSYITIIALDPMFWNNFFPYVRPDDFFKLSTVKEFTDIIIKIRGGTKEKLFCENLKTLNNATRISANSSLTSTAFEQM